MKEFEVKGTIKLDKESEEKIIEELRKINEKDSKLCIVHTRAFLICFISELIALHKSEYADYFS